MGLIRDEGYVELENSVGEQLEELSGQFGEAKDAAEVAAAETVEEAAELAEEAAGAVQEAAEEAVEEASDLAEEAADAAQETVEKAVEEAADLAEEAAGAVQETVEEAVEEASDLAEEAADAAQETVEEAVEQVADLAEEAAGTAEETAEEIAEEAADALEEAAAVLEDAHVEEEIPVTIPDGWVEILPEPEAAEGASPAAAEENAYDSPRQGFEELYGQLDAMKSGAQTAAAEIGEEAGKAAEAFGDVTVPEEIPVAVPAAAEELPSVAETPAEPAPPVMDVINPSRPQEDPFASLDAPAEQPAGETVTIPEPDTDEERDHISPTTGRDIRALKAERRFDLGFGMVFWILFALGILAVAYPFAAEKVEQIPFYPDIYSKVCLFLPAVMGFLAAFTAHFGPFKGFMILLFTGIYALFTSAIGKENPKDFMSYYEEILDNAGRFYYVTVVAILIGALAGYVFTLIFNGIKHKTMEVTGEDRKSAFCAFALMLLAAFSLVCLLGGYFGWEIYAYVFAGLILLLCLAHAIRSGFSVGAMIGCDLLIALALAAGWWFFLSGQGVTFMDFLFDRKGLYIFLGSSLVYLFVEFIGGIIYDGADALVGMLWLLSVTAVGLPLVWNRLSLVGGLQPLVCLIICAVILGLTLFTACLVRGFTVGKVIVGIFLAGLYLFADWLRIVLSGQKGTIYYFTDWESIVYMIVAAGVILVACLFGGLWHRGARKRREKAMAEAGEDVE